MLKHAISIMVNAQEGYIPVYDKSPSRQSVKHAQADKIYSGKRPRRLFTGKKITVSYAGFWQVSR
jgi:hypothetical protein